MAIYLLGLSLRDALGFSQVIALFVRFPVKALAAIVVWALAQHSLSGVRHLLTDSDWPCPRKTYSIAEVENAFMEHER